MICILPYALSLQEEQLRQAVAQTGLPVPALLAISVVQGAVLLAVAVAAGLWASRRIGLGAPLIGAWLTSVPFPPGTRQTLQQAALVGLTCAVIIIALDRLIFLPLDPEGIGALEGAHPPAWQGLLASFYGGIAEELYTRLFLLSLVALGMRAVGRLVGADRESLLPSWAFWGANVFAALIFGLGHLPAAAALVPITSLVVARAIVLNGVAAVPFGWLFQRNGIEAAMVAHFAADILLHAVLPLF